MFFDSNSKSSSLPLLQQIEKLLHSYLDDKKHRNTVREILSHVNTTEIKDKNQTVKDAVDLIWAMIELQGKAQKNAGDYTLYELAFGLATFESTLEKVIKTLTDFYTERYEFSLLIEINEKLNELTALNASNAINGRTLVGDFTWSFLGPLSELPDQFDESVEELGHIYLYNYNNELWFTVIAQTRENEDTDYDTSFHVDRPIYDSKGINFLTKDPSIIANLERGVKTDVINHMLEVICLHVIKAEDNTVDWLNYSLSVKKHLHLISAYPLENLSHPSQEEKTALAGFLESTTPLELATLSDLEGNLNLFKELLRNTLNNKLHSAPR